MAELSRMILERGRGICPSLTTEKAEQMEAFEAFLREKNAAFNLTRVPDDLSESCDRNYLDSLYGARFLEGKQSALDLGSGAGFPGMPLAIACPYVSVTLLETQKKRADFLEEAAQKLGLKNVKVVCARAEDAGKGKLRATQDVVTARAVAGLNVLAELALPLIRTGGLLAAYKGPQARAEAEEARHAFEVLGGGEADFFDAPIPGRDWEHVIVTVLKARETPDTYPRRAGMPEKRPL